MRCLWPSIACLSCDAVRCMRCRAMVRSLRPAPAVDVADNPLADQRLGVTLDGLPLVVAFLFGWQIAFCCGQPVIVSHASHARRDVMRWRRVASMIREGCREAVEHDPFVIAQLRAGGPRWGA